jgi:hypothetical protein
VQTGKEISNSAGNYYNNNNNSAVSTTTLKNVVNDNEKVQFPKKQQQQQQHPDSVLSTEVVLKGRVYDIGNDSNRNKHVEVRAG